VKSSSKGLSRYGIKKAMLEFHGALTGPGPWKAKMILQIHDALLSECPRGEAELLAPMVCERMEAVLALAVQVVVDVGTGASRAEVH